eukprot:718287-Pelagomonas_calceolata.AAC.1
MGVIARHGRGSLLPSFSDHLGMTCQLLSAAVSCLSLPVCGLLGPPPPNMNLSSVYLCTSPHYAAPCYGPCHGYYSHAGQATHPRAHSAGHIPLFNSSWSVHSAAFKWGIKDEGGKCAVDKLLCCSPLQRAALQKRQQPRNSAIIVLTHFWCAEALDCLYPQTKEGMALLTKGIERAKDVAVQIVEQGGLALTRKQVQASAEVLAQGQRGFWYLDLANISFTGHHEFHHPSTLLKLAIFLSTDTRLGFELSPLQLFLPSDHEFPAITSLSQTLDCGYPGAVV